MATTWIVAADASRAKVLQVARREQLVEVDDLLNPSGDHDAFARRIAGYLDKARHRQRYDRLLLVAPPRFLGQMRDALGEEVARLVADDLDRDLSWFTAREIEYYFAPGSERAP